jgi:hypothetical protein
MRQVRGVADLARFLDVLSAVKAGKGKEQSQGSTVKDSDSIGAIAVVRRGPPATTGN